MLLIILSVCVATMATDVAHSRGVNPPYVPDGFTLHTVVTTWEEAHRQCQNEGAILASPLNDNMLNVMRTLIGAYKTSFYIGTKASYSGQYMSIEGVPFENMTAALWQVLDSTDGDCLAMTYDTVRAVDCWSRLPYVCYKPDFNHKTNCGQYGYKYELSTKRCYKQHMDKGSWYEAHLTCVGEGGYLVIIDNYIEARTIKNIFNLDSSWIWTGIRDAEDTGNWISVKGQRVEELYNVWIYGVKPRGRDKHPCVGFVFPAFLHHQTCDLEQYYICEKEPSF